MNAILTYAESEIVRLGLGDSATNCHGVAAYDAGNSAVRLSDGIGFDVTCRFGDEIDSALEEVAAWYAAK